jgi:dTDP-glucose 4,6-dehydratase
MNLGWKPQKKFNQAIEETVNWYLKNEPWWRKIKEKQQDYIRFYQAQYKS